MPGAEFPSFTLPGAVNPGPVAVLPAIVVRRPAPSVPLRISSVRPISGDSSSSSQPGTPKMSSKPGTPRVRTSSQCPGATQSHPLAASNGSPSVVSHVGTPVSQSASVYDPCASPVVITATTPASEVPDAPDRAADGGIKGTTKATPVILGLHPTNTGVDTDSGCSFTTTPTPSECSDRLNTSGNSDSGCPKPEVILPKPTVDVKLLRSTRASCRKLLSRSLDNLDSLDCSDPDEKCSPFEQLDELRSSFLCKDVHLEYDTLSRQLFPRTFKESREHLQCTKGEHIYSSLGDINAINNQNTDAPPDKSASSDKETYSLPEPQSYGDGTLKAVKRITDKYDSLQMRKLRARSFRAGSHQLTGLGKDQSSLDRALLNLQVDTLDFTDRTLTNSAPCSPSVGQPKIPQSSPEESQSPEIVVPVTTGLTDRDVSRVEMFYRSRSTEVVVCSCLADLQIATAQSGGSTATAVAPISSWQHRHTGVPVMVLNTGTGRRNRALHLVLAERDTGFPLWSDRVNYLTNYAERSTTLQAFHVSTSLRTIAAFSFYSAPAAARFHCNFKRLTSDPEDELWSLSNVKKKQKKKAKKVTPSGAGVDVNSNSPSPWKRSASAKIKKVTKNEISQPCHFIHVTNVSPSDNTLMDAFSEYLQHNRPCDAEQEGQPLNLIATSPGPTSLT